MGDIDAKRPDGALRRALHRLSADTAELDDEELQKHVVDRGAQPVYQCPNRQRVSVHGVLRTVTLRPRGGIPSLEAQLYDGTGTVELIWLGRRRIGGVEPGRSVVVNGLITTADGRRTMFNPLYELLPNHH
ncbi:MAG: hypothetical protein QOE76_1584 [Frankiales bacterium]|jgi:hypothetical protein|nr:hypothetical protein [Frankiales bacterium]MDX6243861.1 hypothetical protein [Frankiales bacterium]